MNIYVLKVNKKDQNSGSSKLPCPPHSTLSFSVSHGYSLHSIRFHLWKQKLHTMKCNEESINTNSGTPLQWLQGKFIIIIILKKLFVIIVSQWYLE